MRTFLIAVSTFLALSACAAGQGNGGLFSESDEAVNDGGNSALETAAESDSDGPERGGLFSFLSGNRNGTSAAEGPDAAEVDAQTVLPFGQIARVCGLRRSQMGREVAAGGGFDLFDTNPDATGQRAFYLTGFNDDCARTFTGAVVVPGDVETHEFVRYEPSNDRIPYSAVDEAYEALKSRVCRVRRGEPCGARLGRLDRNTQFITAYGFFGGTFSSVPTKWVQILLHDGEVLAIAMQNE